MPPGPAGRRVSELITIVSSSYNIPIRVIVVNRPRLIISDDRPAIISRPVHPIVGGTADRNVKAETAVVPVLCVRGRDKRAQAQGDSDNRQTNIFL